MGEAGSVKDVNIYNNRISQPSREGASEIQKQTTDPYAIRVKTEDIKSFYRYSNINIHNNKIEGRIFVASTDGVVIKSNQIKAKKPTVETANCTDTNIVDNDESVVCDADL